MNITVDRKVLEMALEALDYEAREEPESAWKQERDSLRTALEQPERKPLTDDEIQALWEKAFESGSSPNAFVRAIEAAHGITEES